MAEDNLKDFTANWVIFGLLFFALVTFAITFMYNNNPTAGLGEDAEAIFGAAENTIESKLYEAPSDADTLLNVTANTNPEASDLGSRDSVASSYSLFGSGRSFFDSMKLFVSWIFSGTIGQMLLAVIGGILGFTGVYFIIKLIRNGI